MSEQMVILASASLDTTLSTCACGSEYDGDVLLPSRHLVGQGTSLRAEQPRGFAASSGISHEHTGLQGLHGPLHLAVGYS